MAEPRFSSPVRQPAFLPGPDVALTDETGVRLTRRFQADVAPGTARLSGKSLEWSVTPGESTVMNGTAPADVDLSHVRAVFRLSGDHAMDVLAAVCALDLSDDMLPNGAAARTLIAGVATELVRDDVEGSPSYLLLPSRSFGNYLWRVLVDAAEGVVTST
jgi:sarcosine oxidase gamma subunit